MKDLQNLTDDQLQAELKRREAQKREDEKAAKQAYETDRNALVTELINYAVDLHKQMAYFKGYALNELNGFAKKAYQYGDIRGNSKGGFSLRSADGTMRVSLVRNTKVEYDERADMAENLIRDFMTDMVKKRDIKVFNFIMALLERGKNNEFNPANIATIIKHEADFNDERWVKAIKLFKESHNVILISMNVEFYTKNSMDKDEAISLTFSSIPLTENAETTEAQAENKQKPVEDM